MVSYILLQVNKKPAFYYSGVLFLRLRYALKNISACSAGIGVHTKKFSDQSDKNCAVNSKNSILVRDAYLRIYSFSMGPPR